MKMFLYQLAQLISDQLDLEEKRQKEIDVSSHLFSEEMDDIKSEKDVCNLCSRLEESLCADFDAFEQKGSYSRAFDLIESYESFKGKKLQEALIHEFLSEHLELDNQS